MLKFLGHPSWHPPDGNPSPLPMTLPGALTLVLAERGDWLDREFVATTFWPEAPPDEAFRRLRMTLHRSRQVLSTWGVASALQAERSRLRLALPTDLQRLEAPGGLALLDDFLTGYRLREGDSEGFDGWIEATLARRAAACRRNEGQAPAPAPGAAIASSMPARPLPGREADLTRLQALLQGSQPAIVLVGEAGMGKTTLARHALPGALWLQGQEMLQALPYRAVSELLRANWQSLRQQMAADPSSSLAAHRLDLARLLPELMPEAPPPPLEATAARTRLAEAMALAVEALGGLLIVDDLPWCDPPTLDWLALLAHRGRTRWLATARPWDASAPVELLLQPLRQRGLLAEVALDGMDPAALARALGQRHPELLPPEAEGPGPWRRLVAASGGNPFIAVECLKCSPGREPPAGAPPPQRVQQLLQNVAAQLPSPARQLAAAAAVAGEPLPLAALAGAALLDEEAAATALQAGVAARLLLQQPDGRVQCRHDLVRQSLQAGVSAEQAARFHRAVAQWLGTQRGADPLGVARHWQAAGCPEQAWPWWHLAARQLKARGEFETARQAWQRIQNASEDVFLALQARLELAAADFFDDLQASRTRVEAVLAQVAALPEGRQRQHIEARALAALVDNAVFSGNLPTAQTHACRLTALLPALPDSDRIDALEVLIELAMRTPDIPACWRYLGELRAASPQRPQVLSFEGQIHWFSGDVRNAAAVLGELLQRFPEYRSGLTIDNDLAVMLQTLGRLQEAEARARDSLRYWAGVAHTETLSLLVLGLVLASAGRDAEASAALLNAVDLARAQASPGFEAEAWVRLARLHLQQGRLDAAEAALGTARGWLQTCAEPMRVSQWAWVEVRLALALGGKAQVHAQRLQDASTRSQHPLVHTRWAHVRALMAQAAGQTVQAAEAAAQMQTLAAATGLAEAEAEALLLQATLHLAAANARVTGADPAASSRRKAAEQARLAALGIAQPCGFTALVAAAQRLQSGQALV